MIEVYKIMSGMLKVIKEMLFTYFHNVRSRGSPNEMHRLQILKRQKERFFFMQQTVSPWNSLPEDILKTRTSTGLKNVFNKFMEDRSEGYACVHFKQNVI